MDLFFLLTLLISPGFLAAFITMICLGNGNSSIPFLLCFILSQLISLLGFRTVVRMNLKRLGESHFRLSRKISSKCNKGEKTIIIEKKDRWECDYSGETVFFSLRGLWFRKSFIEAFVTRALRYPKVSNQLPVKHIAFFRLKGFKASLTVNLIFSMPKREKKKTILKDGISAFGLVAWLMTRICTPPSQSYRYYPSSGEGSSVSHLDEKIFCSFQRMRQSTK